MYLLSIPPSPPKKINKQTKYKKKQTKQNKNMKSYSRKGVQVYSLDLFNFILIVMRLTLPCCLRLVSEWGCFTSALLNLFTTMRLPMMGLECGGTDTMAGNYINRASDITLCLCGIKYVSMVQLDKILRDGCFIRNATTSCLFLMLPN